MINQIVLTLILGFLMIGMATITLMGIYFVWQIIRDDYLERKKKNENIQKN